MTRRREAFKKTFKMLPTLNSIHYATKNLQRMFGLRKFLPFPVAPQSIVCLNWILSFNPGQEVTESKNDYF